MPRNVRSWPRRWMALVLPVVCSMAHDARDPVPAPAPRPWSGISAVGGADQIIHDRPANAAQSSTSLAVNASGSVLVAGFIDGRGAGLSVAGGRSLSGVARSTDGGQTWSVPSLFRTLPVLPAPSNGQVLGDPVVRHDPTRNMWVYASVYVRPSDNRQGLCIHVSFDDGTSWQGPFEVSPSFALGATADKPQMDINKRTGRILITWTHFAAAAEISATFSDNAGLSWSARQVIASGSVQSSFPRFVPGPDNATSRAYVAWRRGGATRNIGFASSGNGGSTWSAPTLLTSDYPAEDEILGVDRVNTSPSLAVDETSGHVYVVYQVNNATGEGDIAFQRSVDQGASFSPRVTINSNPGNDRAQFFPSVAVDQVTRRIHVVWYDQHPSASGDLTELVRTVSADGGGTWSRPVTVLDRPFRAGFGNDSTQPNLGDYLQNAAHGGVHHVVAAATAPAPRFDEGQPGSASLHAPDVHHDQVADPANVAALRLAGAVLAESCAAGGNGFLDPGELGTLTLDLHNYVVNPVASPAAYTGVTGTLSSSTPGVTLLDATQGWPDITSGNAAGNSAPFRISLAPSLVAGTPVDLTLTVATAQGTIQLPHRLATGTPSAQAPLLSEDFNAVAPPGLPAGWSSQHGAGTTTVPWITSAALTATPAAFHANDGAASRWERLLSPNLAVPVPAGGAKSHVTVDFDIVYNTEDVPAQRVLANDGVFLRITDRTTGALLRSVLAEAFAEEFTTGTANHYPKHLARGSDPNTFPGGDMSLWAGSSGGLRHVRMKLPGEGLEGRTVQLSFEYTEGACCACAAPPCGVAIDNVVVRQVLATSQTCPSPDLAVGVVPPAGGVVPGSTFSFTTTVANQGSLDAEAATATAATPAGLTFVSNGGACTTAFPCSLGTLAAGNSAVITSTYSAPSSYTAPDPVTFAVTAATTTPEGNAQNNGGTASAPVSPSADLAVVRTGPAAVVPGTSVSYTITVANAGPSDATASVADSVPSGLGHTGNGGDCATAFPCALSIPAGGTRTITAQYALAASYTAPDPLTATSTVSAAASDPAAGNNTATASSAVTPQADLVVTKVGPPTVRPGGAGVLYTIDVVNNGPSDAALVQLDDPTPTGLTFVSSAGDCTTAFPCSLGTVAAGARRTVTAAFSVPAAYRTPDPVVNTASASSATADPSAGNNSATASSAVSAEADVSVAVTGPATAVPGTPITYSLTARNAGPATADDVTVDHPAPAGLSFVSSTGDCPAGFPCSLGTLNPGDTRSATATYQVPSGYTAPDPIADTATIASTTTDPDLADNTATAASAVRPSADLSVGKTGPVSVAKGTDVTFTVTVANSGPSDAQAVTVADPTPAGLTFVSSSGACTSAYPCALGTIVAGGTRTITSIYSVPPGYGGADPLLNTASAGGATPDPDPSDDGATASVDVTESADLALTKTGPALAVPGAQVVYTIAVTNRGPSSAGGVSVADPAPAGLTFVSNAGDCATAFPCALGTVAPGATRTITSTWSVAPDLAAATIANTATVTGATGDPDPSNDSATVTSTVTRQADLEISIAGPGGVTAGTEATYTVTVRNNGPSTSSGVTVASAAPAGLAWVSNGGDCTTAYPCVFGSVPVGGARSFTSTFRLASSATGSVVNAVSVFSAVPDNVGANDSARATSAVNTSAALSIAKVGPASVVRGTNVVYAITVANAGPSDAAGVSLADVTPPGLTFLASAGGCSTPFPCSLGPVAAGSSKTVTATFAVDPGYAGAVPLLNTAAAATTTPDPSAADNSATASSGVASSADVNVAMTGPASAERGKDVTYTLTVGNAGPSTAEAVTVSLPTPAGLTFKSNAGDCASAFPCDLGPVPPGQAARTIAATFTVSRNAADAALTATATVSSATPDPTATNNTATANLGSGPTGCGCGQAGPGAPPWGLGLGLLALALARRRRRPV